MPKYKPKPKPPRARQPRAHNVCSKKRTVLKEIMRSQHTEITHLQAVSVVLQSQLDHQMQLWKAIVSTFSAKQHRLWDEMAPQVAKVDAGAEEE